MAFNIIRAAIFVLAFGICMSEASEDDSKCDYSDEFLNELDDHVRVCLEKVKPGGDVDKVYEEPEYLSEEQDLAFSVCIDQQLGIMSEDLVFSVKKANEYVEDMRYLNYDKIVDAILAEIKECEKVNDEGVYGIKMMQCVNDAYNKVCYEEEE